MFEELIEKYGLTGARPEFYSAWTGQFDADFSGWLSRTYLEDVNARYTRLGDEAFGALCTAAGALAENPEHIMDCRTCRAGNDANGTRVAWQRLLVGWVKETFRRQLFLQRLESRVEIPYTVHCQCAAIELVCAVPWEYGNLAHGNDLHAVFRTESQPHSVPLKHHTL